MLTFPIGSVKFKLKNCLSSKVLILMQRLAELHKKNKRNIKFFDEFIKIYIKNLKIFNCYKLFLIL